RASGLRRPRARDAAGAAAPCARRGPSRICRGRHFSFEGRRLHLTELCSIALVDSTSLASDTRVLQTSLHPLQQWSSCTNDYRMPPRIRETFVRDPRRMMRNDRLTLAGRHVRRAPAAAAASVLALAVGFVCFLTAFTFAGF